MSCNPGERQRAEAVVPPGAPLNVSVAYGGWFHYDLTSKRFDYHIEHYLVDEKWLLAGGSFATTVAGAHARVTIERTPDTATHMVVHARLDPA